MSKFIVVLEMQIEREIYFQKLASRIFLVLIKLHFILSLIKVLLKYKAEKKELSVHSCKALLLLYQKKVPEQKLVSAQRYSLSIW